MKTTEITKTNDIRHTISINDAKNNIEIKISLNDECHNGHQDFSITGSYWQVGQMRSDRTNLGGGCIHDRILKVRPDLRIFVNLHLCDYTGVPMYAVANGFYRLTEGFNNTKPNDKKFKAEFCEYYRITKEQFDVLSSCENELRYAIKLKSLGILAQWKNEANQAIKLLQDWTDSEFVIDSIKTQYSAPTHKQIMEEEKKEKEGYYTPSKIEARKIASIKAEQNKIRTELKKDLDKTIKKEQDEYNVKIAILNTGTSIDSFIYYNHTNEGVFNWMEDRSYSKHITEAQFNEFKNKINIKGLPKGIIFKLGNKQTA